MASDNISDALRTQYDTYSANKKTFSVFKRVAQVYKFLKKVPQ